MAETPAGGGGFNPGSHIAGLFKTPLEILVGAIMVYALGAVVGSYFQVWTLKQALAVATALAGPLWVVLVSLAGPLALVGLAWAILTAIHNWKKALEYGIASLIVIALSAKFGGFDWVGQVNAVRAGVGH
jgi:hypothetical protein